MKGPLQASKDFLADARKLGLEARAVTMTRGDGLEGIGRDAALEDAVFGLTAGGVSTAIKTPAGWVVAKVVEVLPAGVPPLAEIRNDAIEAIKRERAGALAMDKAKNLAAAASKDGDFAAAAKKEGATAGETTFFSRSETPKEKPTLPGAVLLAALQTPVGQVAEPVRVPSGVYVVKTLERQTPDPKGLDAEREELTKQVLEQKRAQVWESWLATLNQSAKIEMSGQAAAAPAR